MRTEGGLLPTSAPETSSTAPYTAPGTLVEIRDELWLVERSERSSDGGWYVDVQGLSDLVRGTSATFADTIDEIVALDPEQATVKPDTSPRYRDSRLWLEATLRKSSVPLAEPRLTVATQGLVDALPYQVAACRQALDPQNLRPRILLADAVGLGKTIEIGMILSELVRRGRGERILVVTPRHVLEQMQFELWTRFALPFVRLDSVGIQRIRRRLPANRNPFAYFKRAIISIDTLKGDRYLAHLEKQAWDAVVIDESHNVTNNATQNNRVARLLSRRTDALILASATPHNGKTESFAELIRMLEPSAVRPNGELIMDEVRRLVVRRHRHSPEVASIVGADWAERQEPSIFMVAANAIEDEVAAELESTWLHPVPGRGVLSGERARLFPWTLAKAYLSSPAALQATVAERLRKVDDAREEAALNRLSDLAARLVEAGSAKYDRLGTELERIGIKRTGEARVVIFAERVVTLEWLREQLQRDLKLKDEQIRVLHGGLSDVEQQEIVESFKLSSGPIRVLVTSDVASEGVNLHGQCHELVHYDIPWSLIRIEQRNGRIDRYGQRHPPRITTLLLQPSTKAFSGDLRVLRRLIEKEHEAHKALGESASLMGKHTPPAEEEAIRSVLAGEQQFDDVVRSVDDVIDDGGLEGLLASLAAPVTAPAAPPDDKLQDSLYDGAVPFLHDALAAAFVTPAADPTAGGVGWREYPKQAIVEFEPSADLRQRLEVLPQAYLRDRRVTEGLRLATSASRGKQALEAARSSESSSLWPEAHFLAPLHPALEWAADRALASLRRNEVFAVAIPGASSPALIVQGTLTNARGQVVAANHLVAHFLDAEHAEPTMVQPFVSLRAALDELGFTGTLANTGAVPDDSNLGRYVGPGVRAARSFLATQLEAVKSDVEARVAEWVARVGSWEQQAMELFQGYELRERRRAVADEQGLAEAMRPSEQAVRPLLLVVPSGGEA